MDFIEAIKKGLEASKNYDRNLDQIIEVINEANKAIYDKTGIVGAFVGVTGDKEFTMTPACRSLNISRQDGFPLTLDTIGGHYRAVDKDDLYEVMHSILSHPNFGFYVRRLMKNNK
ncbi:hypothetical protein [Acinetobacter phage Ab65]|nr:hypothetical protein [Acinetobacter phage Ab31]WMC00507.1 hypothetical protein [Acinetobacter phage Ab59]WMC00649.1 hypothetical protein [Acinetobacter phage Ab65]